MVCRYLDFDGCISLGSIYLQFVCSGVRRTFCSKWQSCQTCQSKSLIFLAHHTKHTLLSVWDVRMWKQFSFCSQSLWGHILALKRSSGLHNTNLKRWQSRFLPLKNKIICLISTVTAVSAFSRACFWDVHEHSAQPPLVHTSPIMHSTVKLNGNSRQLKVKCR